MHKSNGPNSKSTKERKSEEISRMHKPNGPNSTNTKATVSVHSESQNKEVSNFVFYAQSLCTQTVSSCKSDECFDQTATPPAPDQWNLEQWCAVRHWHVLCKDLLELQQHQYLINGSENRDAQAEDNVYVLSSDLIKL